MAERSLTRLLESVRHDAEPARIVDLAIAAARKHLGMDVGFLSEFVDGHQAYRRLSGDTGAFGLEEDGSRPLEGTYCKRVVEGVAPQVIPDAPADPVVGPLPVTAEVGIGAYVGVPVRLPDGDLYGTLCCLSRDPDPGLRQRDAGFLEVIATIVGEAVGRERDALRRRQERMDAITEAIELRRLHIAFQPIVSIADGRVSGLEALARFDGEPYRTPDLWFADADAVGLLTELELLAAEMALAELVHVPEPAYVTINLSPATVAAPELIAALERSDPRRIVVEVTEHAIADDLDLLAAATGRIRALGARLAVDDVGAGYSGLNHIVRLGPDIIKLDRFLVSGVDRDPARQALLAAAASFAARARTRVIAEGVETDAEDEQLRRLGIRYAQGYRYGRARPLNV